MLKLARLVFSLMVILVIAACAGAASGPPGFNENPRQTGPAPTLAPVPAGGPTGGGDLAGSPLPATDQTLIVYTGSLQMDVTDLTAAIDAGRALVIGLGGYVGAAQVRNDSDSSSADITYRIPADRWEEALTGLRKIGQKVTAEQESSEDVTSQVIDLDARLANLRATETALQAIMQRATTITDVLKVQDQLTSVQGDIESMQAQRDHIAQQAAYGTLEVIYSVPVTKAAVVASGWSLGDEIDGALATLAQIGQRLVSVLVWLLIVGLPVFVPLAVLALIARWWRRRWVAGHPRPVAAAAPDQQGWR